jgi:hypothetical protein
MVARGSVLDAVDEAVAAAKRVIARRDRRIGDPFFPAAHSECHSPGSARKTPPTEIAGMSGEWQLSGSAGKNSHAGRSQEMPETSDWQLIGQVPIDTGRLALVDPMNVDDVARHEEDPPGSMTYEVVTNRYGVGVAVLLGTGLGDGVYPVEARFEEAEGAVRIAEVRGRFLPHPVIGYELPR